MRWIDTRSAWRLGVVVALAVLLGACSGTPTRPRENGGQGLSKSERAVAGERFTTALVQMKQGNRVEAEKALLEMTKRWPSLSGPFANLGLIYLRQGDTAKAEQMLVKAVTIKPKSAAAWNALGFVRRGQGDFRGAEQAYRKAVAAAPDDADAHRNLGILYDLYLDRPKAALAEYRACQRLAKGEDKEMMRWIAVTERRVSTQVAGRERR